MNAIDAAADRMVAAKERIAEAQAQYNEALEEWIALVPGKDEGAVLTAGNVYKVTTTFNVNRTVDQAAVASLLSDAKYTWAVQRLFPVKFGLSIEEMRFFQRNEPEFYAQLAQAITAKPGKPSVRIERVAAELEAA